MASPVRAWSLIRCGLFAIIVLTMIGWLGRAPSLLARFDQRSGGTAKAGGERMLLDLVYRTRLGR